MDAGKIRITGAREHNLRNLSLEIPKNKLVVITGVSGSGKSSLAFDTLYAEGQRRYVESLSAYARQFLERLEKPDVDAIEGLSPAIAIEQRTSTPNPRSTVATTTEIYDYLRVIYAAAGQPHDPQTGVPLVRKTIPEIAAALIAAGEGAKLVLLAPVPEPEWRGSGGLKAFLARLKKQGFIRVRIAGEIHDVEEIGAATVAELEGRLERGRSAKDGDPADRPVEIVIDRLTARADARDRLIDSVRTALRQSGHEVRALIGDAAGGWREERFSTGFTNPRSGFRLPELTPRHFSFNSHAGACPACEGLGIRLECDPALLVSDAKRSLADGAIKSWWARNPKLLAVHKRQISALAAHFSVDESAPFESLPPEFKSALFHGTTAPIRTGWKTGGTTRSVAKPFEGLCRQAERLHETSESEFVRMNVARFMNPKPCPACNGRRLKPEILAVTLRGGCGSAHRSVGVPPMSEGMAGEAGGGAHGPEGHATGRATLRA